MFKPCHCKVSVAFVHVACLNEWRKTSDSAYYQCPICKFQYNIQKTKMASLLCNEQFVACVAIACILVATLVIGFLTITIGSYFIEGDVVSYFVDKLGLYDSHKYRNIRSISNLIIEIQSADYFENDITNNSILLRTIQYIFQYYYSMILFILSHPNVLAIVDWFMVGFVICGILGFGYHIRQMCTEEDNVGGMLHIHIVSNIYI